MKTLIAAVVLSLAAGSAMAAEGNGNPFPFTANPLAVWNGGQQQVPSLAQNMRSTPAPAATRLAQPTIEAGRTHG